MDRRIAVPLSSFMDVKHGYSFEGRYFVSEPTEYILLTPGNFRKGEGLFFGSKITYYDGPVPGGFVLDDGDLLIVMTDLTKEMAILGSAAVLRPNGPDDDGTPDKRILHNQRIGKVILRPGNHTHRGFLTYLLNSHAVRGEIKATATGTTVRHTSPDKILKIEVCIPPPPNRKRSRPYCPNGIGPSP